ncbi:E3 ubiquitin-protein ligase SH3RF3-like isoform X3 [Triplophysa rosa]|uniref:E3 ubiquitin-protein ligase SH3RF3-like isoform X3 n=1 Tax=Triplophysa rosa TaxID=992332 RepID=UPI002545CE00|nr:E3 ubiquitin-protein ligase SH3RF3-like isoform X3 [Triplophysa rosa]
MDESSLLDLLECSVCLERLDASARVLPCQHTFCRRCLENIVSSRHELRCPECRILVDCAVDDLPANILLVRLLDGIKQRPRNGGGRPSLAGCAAGVSASPPGTAVRDLPVATRSSPVKNVPQLPCGKALYSYEGKEPGDLKFNKGDIIILRRKVDENWYHGELNGSHGFLPASYIQCIRPLSQTPPQGKALYDFEVKDKDQDKDCLTFTKDEILTVIRRVDDNWAEGMLGDKIGIFPILYVEDCSVTSAPGVSSRVTSTSGDLLAATKVQLPLNIYLALYAYKPQKADELELRKGEMYRVMEKCQDGWFKGTAMRSGASGVFPGNYVTPVSRAPFAVGQTRACVSDRMTSAPGSPGSTGPSSPVLLPSASRSSTPLNSPSSPQLQHAAMHLKNCLRSQQAVNQTRSPKQLVHSPERVPSGVSPLRAQASPSRSPCSSRPLSMVAAPQSHSSHQPAPLCPASVRPLVPLSSAAAAITPPNMSAAHLNGGDAPVCPLSSSSPAHAHTAVTGFHKLEEKKKEKKSSGLLKLLSGAAAKKKSRSPPSVSPTHDPRVPSVKPSSSSVQGAMAPELRSAGGHGRAGSCPIESEMQGAMGMVPLHRKSGSLDLNFSVSPPARQPCSSSPLAIRPEPKPLSRDRYRVVVPYPPQSEAEIELKEGDIVFVHKKREDGWYKGTLQRTGRTGLFPGSFVEIF